jgi:peptidoglycan hydrolase-like protein with peptidoglycan-binding domain
MMKFLRNKVSAVALGVVLLGALAATPAIAANEGRCGYGGSHSTVRPGNRSPQAAHAQCLLKHYQGFGDQQITGFYGAQTGRNVRAFQRNRGLAADGVIGPQTWSRLHP